MRALADRVEVCRPRVQIEPPAGLDDLARMSMRRRVGAGVDRRHHVGQAHAARVVEVPGQLGPGQRSRKALADITRSNSSVRTSIARSAPRCEQVSRRVDVAAGPRRLAGHGMLDLDEHLARAGAVERLQSGALTLNDGVQLEGNA